MEITAHFTLEELIRTSTGLENDPPVEAGSSLIRLAELVLEPIRVLLGVPLIVHSGYRSPAVNRKVGGDPKSAHLEGRACDFHPGGGLLIRDAFDRILASGIPFDKLILEEKQDRWWIHAQIPRLGCQSRRLAYFASVTGSGTVYVEVGRG